jgi:hypothetical protein
MTRGRVLWCTTAVVPSCLARQPPGHQQPYVEDQDQLETQAGTLLQIIRSASSGGVGVHAFEDHEAWTAVSEAAPYPCGRRTSCFPAAHFVLPTQSTGLRRSTVWASAVRLTATVTATSATVDSRRRTPTTVYLGMEPLSRVVVRPEKRKVGGSTPPLPTAYEQPKDPRANSPGVF